MITFMDIAALVFMIQQILFVHTYPDLALILPDVMEKDKASDSKKVRRKTVLGASLTILLIFGTFIIGVCFKVLELAFYFNLIEYSIYFLIFLLTIYSKINEAVKR